MKFYLEMMKKPVFTSEDIAAVYTNDKSGNNYVLKLVSEGYVERIRKNMYTCISPETGLPIASKYQIASAITDTSFVSHHTALEYYGVTDQVYYDVYVSSATRFKEFEYDVSENYGKKFAEFVLKNGGKEMMEEIKKQIKE